ncbi:MAG: hypothetical protein ACRC46_07190 [Thermoguttaceae bacterium]
MPPATTKTPPAVPPAPTDVASDKPGLAPRNRLMITVAVVAIVGLELLLFVLLLPSPRQVADAVVDAADERLKSPMDYKLNAPVSEVSPVLPSNQVERPLGEEKFKATTTNPASPDRIEVFEVKLFARINKSDVAKWDALYLANQQTIRQEINLVLRQAKSEYKLDPKLTVIRNSIRVRLNEILGHSYIQQVIFSDVSLNVN